MKDRTGNRVIYQLNAADLQEVSEEFLERRLTEKEVRLVENSVGDYIDWTQAIKHAIQKHIDE